MKYYQRVEVKQDYAQPVVWYKKAVEQRNASFTWYLEDGIEIRVSRGWPSTTTYLAFIHPENNAATEKERSRRKGERETKQSESQSKRF